MALRLGYVFRETGSNLRRNITLFLATIVAVWVCATLGGASLLISEGVEQATGRWRGGIEFIVFMNAEADEAQHQAVRDTLDSNPEVQDWTFVDQQEAYDEFLEEFADSPELVESVTPEVLPPSYRVNPVSDDADVIEALAQSFDTQPGVRDVVLAVDVIRALQSNSEKISLVILGVAIVVLIAALLLIFNTIRTAIFARRRDIEVMKLVGASNWFIRIPFMVEGTVQGLLGGLLAVPMLFLINNLFEGFVEGEELELLRSLVVDTAVVWNTSIIVVVVATVFAAGASAVAVGRFLDV